MSISREKILERRKKLQNQREKDEAKLKALQLKLRRSAQKIAQVQKKEEAERKMILGSFMLEKAKVDESFKLWLDGEIASSPLNSHEKSLFGIFAQT